MNRQLSQVIAALVVVLGGIIYITITQESTLTRPAATWNTRSNNGTDEWSRTVVLVSLDGLRPDYLTSGYLPNLLSLSKGEWPLTLTKAVGILTTKAMIPVSPSLTFPNHWSIQTGLQPSSHGIIANDFHTASNRSFYYTDPTRSWEASFWKGVSIWEQLESLKIRSANLMWPGPPITSSGIENTYFQKYVKGWSLEKRLDMILSWLDKTTQERPRFICGKCTLLCLHAPLS
jgi:predicted AlkP superfamily pyrophosphatase or phosphodiesterase